MRMISRMSRCGSAIKLRHLSTVPSEIKSPHVDLDQKSDKSAFLRPLSKDMLLNQYNLDLLVYPEISNTPDVEKVTYLSDKLKELMRLLNDAHDHEHRRAIIDKITRTGVLGLCLPRIYLGSDYDLMMFTRVVEAVSMDTELLLCTFNPNTLAAQAILRAGDENQKQSYLPRFVQGELKATVAMNESSLDDLRLPEIKTVAVLDKTDQSYLINGSKSLVFGLNNADYIIVFAKTSQHWVSPFIVDAKSSGISTKHINSMIDCHEVQFDNVRVPVENILTGIPGVELMRKLGTISNISTAASSSTVIRSLLEETNQFLCNRLVFGKPLSQFESINYRICSLTDDAYLSESLAYYVAGMMEQYPNNDLYIESCLAKVASLEALSRSTNLCVRMMGTASLSNSNSKMTVAYKNSHNLLLNQIPQIDTKNSLMKESMVYMMNNLSTKKMDLVRLSKKIGVLNITGVLENKYVVDSLKYNLHPRVGQLADSVYVELRNMILFVEKTLKNDHQELSKNDEFLEKLSHILIQVFTLFTVFSRASRSIAIGLRNNELEVKVAEYHAIRVLPKIRKDVEELKRFPGNVTRINKAASSMKEMGGYLDMNKLSTDL